MMAGEVGDALATLLNQMLSRLICAKKNRRSPPGLLQIIV
jgi:hypothetical protein